MEKFKRLLRFIIPAVIILSVLIWIFFPISIDSLLIKESSKLSAVAVSVTATFSDGTTTEYYLTGEELEAFRTLAKDSYAHLNPIKKKWVNSSNMDKSISVFPEYEGQIQQGKVPPHLSFFTSKIITIDNKQYYLYGDKFLKGISELTNK